MDRDNNQISSVLNTLWQKLLVSRDAGQPYVYDIVALLNNCDSSVDSLKDRLVGFISAWESKLVLNKQNIITEITSNSVYNTVSNKSVDAQRIITAYQNLDLNNTDSIDAFSHSLTNQVQAFFDYKPGDSVKILINNVSGLITNSIAIYQLLRKDLVVDDLIHTFKSILNNVIEILSVLLNLDENDKARFQPILDSSEIIAERIHDIVDIEGSSVTDAQKTASIHTKLAAIDTELQKLNSSEEEVIKEVKAKDIYESTKEFIEINDNIALRGYLEDAKVAVEGIFGRAMKIDYGDPRVQTILQSVKTKLIKWLSLPDDFRPNNWIEVIHHIVKNIRISSKETLLNMGGYFTKMYHVLEKLEHILEYVDNDSFKLIVSAKEKTRMHNIELDEIIDLDEEKGSPSFQSVQLEAALSDEPVNENSNNLELETNVNVETPKPYDIIHYLCFDETYGATAKVQTPEYVTAIENLYFGTWNSNLVDGFKQAIADFINSEAVQNLFNPLKETIFKVGGFVVHEIVDRVVDFIVSMVSKLVELLDTLIKQVINQIHTLFKALIALFQSVDLPPAVKDILKRLPPFKEWPASVTFLHIIMAIPYTLYREFVQFEMPSQAQKVA